MSFNNSTRGNNGLDVIDTISLAQLILVFVIGTFGNIYVIYRFRVKRPWRRKRFESLLAILACTDLLASIFIPVLFLYATITQFQRWDFGFYGCKIMLGFLPTTITMSLGILLLISYERYKAISNPLEASLNSCTIKFWILLIFVFGILLVIPYSYSLEIVSDHVNNIHTCIPRNGAGPLILTFALGNFIRDFLAAVILFIFGYKTHAVLKEKVSVKLSAVKARLRNIAKATKMLIVVVTVFSFCVIPLDLFQLCLYIVVMGGYRPSQTVYLKIIKINTVLTVLQISNSATNVIIYSKMQQGFLKPIYSCQGRLESVSLKLKRLQDNESSQSDEKNTFV